MVEEEEAEAVETEIAQEEAKVVADAEEELRVEEANQHLAELEAVVAILKIPEVGEEEDKS